MTIYLIAVVWSAVTMWRIRLLIRFYQLEEYKSGRFLRWALDNPSRWAPPNVLLGSGFAVGMSILMRLAAVDTDAIYIIVSVIAAGIAAYSQPAPEVKKRFVATQRARRLLGTAFALALLLNVGLATLAGATIDADDSSLVMTTIVGAVLLVAAPLALPAANILMFPVEESLRRGFRAKARKRLQTAAPVVIGITGSYGKTSTKQYLAHILEGRYRVLATPKSYNTLMGVCLTINNSLDPTAGYQYFVAEMGAYVPGEIAGICKLTNPDISIVTAVGPQHLERFGSIENIEKAKYEIVAGVPADGTTVFNFDDPRVRRMEKRGHPDTRFGVSATEPPDADARLIATNIQHTVDGLRFAVTDRQTNTQHTFHTSLIGLHNVTNILLATTVALETGMKLNEIALRVASLEPAEHRLRRNKLPNGITLIDDAYNTNPVGARNALAVLSLHTEGRRVLVTPGMVELADIQAQENRKLGEVAATHTTDIILVGQEQTAPIKEGVLSTDFDPAHLIVVDTVQEAIAWYQTNLTSGDAILFLNDLADNYL